jgi:hypothetical protein
MFQNRAYQKALSKNLEEEKVKYQLPLLIAIGIFGYFHYRYHYCWKISHALVLSIQKDGF